MLKTPGESIQHCTITRRSGASSFHPKYTETGSHADDPRLVVVHLQKTHFYYILLTNKRHSNAKKIVFVNKSKTTSPSYIDGPIGASSSYPVSPPWIYENTRT